MTLLSNIFLHIAAIIYTLIGEADISIWLDFIKDVFN